MVVLIIIFIISPLLLLATTTWICFAQIIASPNKNRVIRGTELGMLICVFDSFPAPISKMLKVGKTCSNYHK